MPFDISEKLVISVASSALFDLSESDAVFREDGERAYRTYQHEHEQDQLPKGVAFPFIRRILSLNDFFAEQQPIEVILVSKNDPDTGQRVFNSIRDYGLPITRGAFLSGSQPHPYLGAFESSLFLSADTDDVYSAIEAGYAAGTVLQSSEAGDDDPDAGLLRVAYDFDGVIADDSSENIYQSEGLGEFLRREEETALEPLHAGPLSRFFIKLSRLQQIERELKELDDSYEQHIRTAIITARNAPAEKRVVTTMRSWDVSADETFFLGGIDKSRFLKIFRPHIFFDDQLTHLEPASGFIPSVHIPFGKMNRRGE